MPGAFHPHPMPRNSKIRPGKWRNESISFNSGQLRPIALLSRSFHRRVIRCNGIVDAGGTQQNAICHAFQPRWLGVFVQRLKAKAVNTPVTSWRSNPSMRRPVSVKRFFDFSLFSSSFFRFPNCSH